MCLEIFLFCPSCFLIFMFMQSVTSEKEQIKQLVYNLENLTMNAENASENVVWVIDFRGWTLSSTPLAMTRQSMNIIQNYYPGLVSVVILCNPPKIFQSFWKILTKNNLLTLLSLRLSKHSRNRFFSTEHYLNTTVHFHKCSIHVCFTYFYSIVE